MKKQLLFVCMMVMALVNVKAADLLVEEFGLAPAYGSIQSAVTAAANGDRIIIKNRAGNIPWVENVTINKTLELLPFANDTFFIVQGNYSIILAANRTVSIIGMYNTTGNIAASGAGTSGNNGVLNVFSSFLFNGTLGTTNTFNTLNLYGSKINGSVTLSHGTVVGNDIFSSGAALEVVSASAANNDTIFIIGNRISNPVSNVTSNYALSWSNNTSFFDIRNNFISSSYLGIYITSSRNTSATVNKIYNNSVSMNNYTSSSTVYGMYINTSTNTYVEIMNNIVDKNSSSTSAVFNGIHAFPGSNGQANAYFNFVDNQFSSTFNSNFTVQSNNTVNQAITLGGFGALAGVGVNGGNPANLFFDLDLTRNDVGAWGGSFTQANFFPLFTGAARTWLTSYPYNIRSGNTLTIKATSFDR